MVENTDELPWDSGKAADAYRKLWLAVAEKAEFAALESRDVLETLRWAQLSEAAYFQATGEGDYESLRSLAQVLSTRSQSQAEEAGR
jgi:hypothetical protein